MPLGTTEENQSLSSHSGIFTELFFINVHCPISNKPKEKKKIYIYIFLPDRSCNWDNYFCTLIGRKIKMSLAEYGCWEFGNKKKKGSSRGERRRRKESSADAKVFQFSALETRANATIRMSGEIVK